MFKNFGFHSLIKKESWARLVWSKKDNHLISIIKYSYFPHKVPLSFVASIGIIITTGESEILSQHSVDLLSNPE